MTRTVNKEDGTLRIEDGHENILKQRNEAVTISHRLTHHAFHFGVEAIKSKTGK